MTKRYGSTLAVDDLSFEVHPGQVTGFLGPNGAGKSTTMRMILGLDTPSGGGVTINGKPYRDHDRPLFEVGALLDARACHGGRSVRNHLWCLAQSNGISRRRAGQMLEMVGLSSVAGHRCGGLSLGMSQRLGIAAALLGDPATLLFDEPVNGLDPEGIRWVRTLLKSLAGEGRTVLVSSHLMSEMALTADHLVVIGKGRLIAETSVADFVRRSSANYIRVRSPHADRLAPLLAAAGAEMSDDDGALGVIGLPIARVGDLAASHGVALHELSPQAASLEEAFIELTGDSVEYRGGQTYPDRADLVGTAPAPQER